MAAILGKTHLKVTLLMQVLDGDPVPLGTLSIPVDVATIEGPALPIIGDGEKLVLKDLSVNADLNSATLRTAVSAGLHEAADSLVRE